MSSRLILNSQHNIRNMVNAAMEREPGEPPGLFPRSGIEMFPAEYAVHSDLVRQLRIANLRHQRDRDARLARMQEAAASRLVIMQAAAEERRLQRIEVLRGRGSYSVGTADAVNAVGNHVLSSSIKALIPFSFLF